MDEQRKPPILFPSQELRSPFAEPPEPRPIGEDAGMRMLLPVGRSIWAIVAGYLGLISILALPGPFALFCGIMAIIDIRKHPDRHGMGRAIFGIVMGAIGSILLAIGIIATMSHS